MVDILHRVGIKSPSTDPAYRALAALSGLADWWTDRVEGEDRIGGVIRFWFGEGFIEVQVLALEPGRQVVWKVTGGPEDWIGTLIRFDLTQEGDYAVLRFKHQGWREPVDFMAHCSSKWAVFLMSLKSLVETGQGRPWPHDVKVHDTH